MDRRDVDIGPVLENRHVGAFQLMTLAFGCLILFVDGLDYRGARSCGGGRLCGIGRAAAKPVGPCGLRARRRGAAGNR